jgi:hypothetical protein
MAGPEGWASGKFGDYGGERGGMRMCCVDIDNTGRVRALARMAF